MAEQPTCEQRWKENKDDEIETLRKLIYAYTHDNKRAERIREEYGELEEHGLGFDYVAPGTFGDQNEGYWRYQISWGGPSDEFRIYASGPNDRPYRIEYWFLDWFDGHGQALRGEDLETLEWMWDWFEPSRQYVYDQARED